MAIKDSDAVDPSLSFENDIVAEFLSSDSTAAGSRPHALSEYYREGGKVPSASPTNDRIPLSGSISFHDFYGAVNQIVVNVANGIYDGSTNKANISGAPSGGYPTLNLYDLAQSSGGLTPSSGKISTPVTFIIDATTRVRNIEIGGRFANLTIENSGMIFGEGGSGSSFSGRPGTAGIIFTSNDSCDVVSIINNSGGYIAGGGNGGAKVATSGLSNNFAQAPGGGGAGGGVPGFKAFVQLSPGGFGSKGASATLGSITGTGLTDTASNGTVERKTSGGPNLVGTVTVGQGGQAGGGGGRAAAARNSSGDAHARASMAGGGGAVFPAGTTGANGGGGSNLTGLGAPSGGVGYSALTGGAGGSFGDANAISGTGNITDFSYVNNGTFYGAVT